ncbi:MAG: PIN domain nuclease [Thermodesulfobacteriota bacterium]|nr:PIN domain nuclease [Thermodesulfobacteriota bacterium]
MILIDTSAWITSFKKTGNDELKEFMRQAIVSGLAVTSPVIILELLQGCRSVEERDALKINLESLDILSITLSVWEQAYEFGFSLRRKGLTIPTVDLIIAALAIENKSLLLHHDDHFEMIASNYPDLKTKYFGSKH